MSILGNTRPYYQLVDDEDARNEAIAALVRASQNAGPALMAAERSPSPLEAMELDADPNPPAHAAVVQDDGPTRLHLDPIEGLVNAARGGSASSAPAPASAEDDGPGVNGWAIAAALLSRDPGTALGSVMTTAAGQRDKWKAEKQKLAAQALDDDFKRSQIATANRNAELRAAELEHALHPDQVPLSKMQEAQLEMERGRLASADARAAKDDERADAQLAEMKAQHQLLNEDRDAARADRAQSNQWAREDRARALLDRQDARDEKTAAAAKAAEDALAPIPGSHVVNDAAWRAAAGKAPQRAQVEKLVGLMKNADDAIARMQEIRKAEGTEYLGSTAQAEYDALRTQAIAAYTDIGKSGVLNGTEYARYAKMLPGIGVADTWKSDAIDGLVNAGRTALGQPKRDTILDQLAGARKGTQSAIKNSLAAYGIELGDAPLPAAPDSSALNRRLGGYARTPAAPPAGDTLPITRGRVPKVSDVIGQVRDDEDDPFSRYSIGGR